MICLCEIDEENWRTPICAAKEQEGLGSAETDQDESIMELAL